MPEPFQDRKAPHPWLCWIDFPRVEVEHNGASLSITTAQQELGEAVWIDAEISTAAARDSSAKQYGTAQRNLDKRTVQLVDGEGRTTKPVVGVKTDRIDRGIILDPMGGQYVDGPKRVLGDAEGWRPEPDNILMNAWLSCGQSPLEIHFEIRRCHRRQQVVRIPVCCDFVSALADLTDQVGQSLRDPSQDKKGCPGVMPLQEVQDPGRAFGDTQLTINPSVPLDDRTEIGYAEPILEIDRHRIQHGRGACLPLAGARTGDDRGPLQVPVCNSKQRAPR